MQSMLCNEIMRSYYFISIFIVIIVEDVIEVKPKTVKKKKVNNVNRKETIAVIPQNNWIIQKRRNSNVPYDAKLVYHRLYSEKD